MKDKPIEQPVNVQRRSFLRRAGIAPAAGLAAVLGASTSAAPTAAPQAQDDAPQSRGYHETEHIRKYYETARF